MPGRLLMDQQSAIGSQDLKRDRSHAQEEIPHPQPAPSKSQSMTPTNAPWNHGPNGVLPNGVPATEYHPPTTNGESGVATMAFAEPGNPPALDQSWRQGDSYKPFGLLVERLAQSCYRDLNVTLKEMSEISVQPQQHQPNGVLPYTGEDTDEGSRRKKRLLMEFAKEQRDRFIKTLVLSDWARNTQDQPKVIDVKVWQDEQANAQFNAASAIGRTLAQMQPAKVPRPNIEGAMELLATSKASWIPHLGYLPPKRLTAKQLLKTLRNMNVILATRLNLHEDLPLPFQDYSVADGRATFIVKGEFEVDLSVADEDPATPFYFIDIRLLFTPASNVLDDRLRSIMEAKVNQELASKGLKGCYDFLHNFVITHKINVLRSQATEMIRGKWFDCIRPESLRRNLVVQYWCGIPGPKSWIEIGISSGKAKTASSRRSATPHISVRWFRRGVEVTDTVWEFDWQHLNLEECLLSVIGKHIQWVLNDLKNRISGLAGPSSPTTLEVTDLDGASENLSLSLNQDYLREPVQVRLEPVTGQYSITPAMAATARAERRLNNDPTANSAKWLAWVVCIAILERVRKKAELLGWNHISNLAKQENLHRVFGDTVRHISVYSPSKAWGDHWGLAVTFSLSGQEWWAVSLDGMKDEQGNVNNMIITSARRISRSDQHAGESPISRASLMRIERLAVSEVAFSALTKELKDKHIPYSIEKLAKGANNNEVADQSVTAPVAMFIQFSALMKPTGQKTWKPWAEEMVRLTHHGFSDDSAVARDDPGSIRHELRLTLEPGKLGSLQRYLTSFKDRDLAMNASGGLALRFLTPFGQPFVEHIQKRLQSVQRLDHCVTVLQKARFKCTRVSLSTLAFTYNDSPELSAQLEFCKDGGLPVRLTLYPPETNPHLRTRVLLEQSLNNLLDNSFGTFIHVLKFTLPVLQDLEQLENAHLAKQTFETHLRTAICFRLEYRAPLPVCEFQLTAKKKIEGGSTTLKWLLEEVHHPRNSSGWPVGFENALTVFWQSSGEHFEGIGNGIISDSQGIGQVLKRLDEVVRQAGTSGASEPKVENDTQQPATQAVAPAQGQTARPSTGNAKTTPIKSDPDVIMLD